MAEQAAAAAASAPGKVLLAGGYLVMDRRHTGLVLGLSARISAVAAAIATSEGVQLNEVVVASPQFVGAQWRYEYRRAADGGGVKVTQLKIGSEISANRFVETTLSYALSYIDHVAVRSSSRSINAVRVLLLADNAYYSQSTPTASHEGRFARFLVSIEKAHKTGLGSSAALVTALTAALLSHYLPRSAFDLDKVDGKRRLHNLVQAAHCAAQGKVGSGFDVAAAVYGTCRYRRFSPEILGEMPEPGDAGFSERLAAVVDDGACWDAEIVTDALRLPDGLTLRMCDVDCGSQTVGMVKRMLQWRSDDPASSTKLWDELQAHNDELARALSSGNVEALPTIMTAARALLRKMGALSVVPVEPASQTELLDALSSLEGVYGGTVPGAGGFDALALLMRDDDATRQRVEDGLACWVGEGGRRARLLDVQGEMQGARMEYVEQFTAWL